MKSLLTGSILLLPIFSTGVMAAAPAADSVGWRLLPHAAVHADGVYLNEIAEGASGAPPHIRITDAPPVGRVLALTRVQVAALAQQAAPELAEADWSGAAQVRISRRMRLLEEAEVKELLTAALQKGFVKERGTLELRLTRPWVTASIADEPFTLKILDLPSAGVTPNFVVRFELRAGETLLGNWQLPLQAKIWRDVWVAGSALQRGQTLASADVVQERRDVLVVRNALADLAPNDTNVEIAESIQAGSVLTLRSLRLRPVVRRGRVVEALVQEGPLTISVKAEVLEDGVVGQTVRARNLNSRREIRGKVQNEETILVAL
ncbi:MAG: flagellar basal body P-ring formation chaperone FlgA [Verrucomicrobiia bacterium]